ncbi:MAG: hypothetical protein VKN72_11535 [Nostocales cyanobacterium 94392]|nr:hypothetical protein [Nostocales cyanobacterium 94392]
MDKHDYLYPRRFYRGDLEPKNVVFNAHLQEFSQIVEYITNLQTGGKISAAKAYQQIRTAYKRLKHSKKQLEIGNASQ